ncbi:MAG: hypothetical protein HZB45_27135 [Mycolicibacterium rufum]|nr:hypothetical protein [Mycolicibacterium rufum]
MSTPPTKTPLLTLRAFVLILVSLLVAAIAGFLTYLGSREIVGAVLAGGGAFAATLKLLDTLVA